ncbi:unnamed protein product [Echinostoma caproni]|uniref:Si:ch73-389k6.1 n=1 Tax=Echinostoma caproni TaxID=27848 RepID=A0A183A8G5_9TREM|nr:unnamed protein product [Echinostoma caproni]
MHNCRFYWTACDAEELDCNIGHRTVQCKRSSAPQMVNFRSQPSEKLLSDACDSLSLGQADGVDFVDSVDHTLLKATSGFSAQASDEGEDDFSLPPLLTLQTSDSLHCGQSTFPPPTTNDPPQLGVQELDVSLAHSPCRQTTSNTSPKPSLELAWPKIAPKSSTSPAASLKINTSPLYAPVNLNTVVQASANHNDRTYCISNPKPHRRPGQFPLRSGAAILRPRQSVTGLQVNNLSTLPTTRRKPIITLQGNMVSSANRSAGITPAWLPHLTLVHSNASLALGKPTTIRYANSYPVFSSSLAGKPYA